MKTRMPAVSIAGAGLAAALATGAFAQDRQRGVEEQADRFIARMDTDADGRVSSTEFSDARAQQIDRYFQRRDTDGNGLISAGEFAEPPAKPERRRIRGSRAGRPAIDQDALAACVRDSAGDFEPRNERRVDEGFATVDSNADGVLDLDEVTALLEAGAQEQFMRLDADADGYITSTEAGAQHGERRDLRRVTRSCLQEQRRG